MCFWICWSMMIKGWCVWLCRMWIWALFWCRVSRVGTRWRIRFGIVRWCFGVVVVWNCGVRERWVVILLVLNLCMWIVIGIVWFIWAFRRGRRVIRARIRVIISGLMEGMEWWWRLMGVDMWWRRCWWCCMSWRWWLRCEGWRLWRTTLSFRGFEGCWIISSCCVRRFVKKWESCVRCGRKMKVRKWWWMKWWMCFII